MQYWWFSSACCCQWLKHCSIAGIWQSTTWQVIIADHLFFYIHYLRFSKIFRKISPTWPNRFHTDLDNSREAVTQLHCESKNKTPNSCPWLHIIFTDFHFFTVGLNNGKFATNLCLNILPCLKLVATLPCEIGMSEKWRQCDMCCN